jgi:undecaprenyl-diphosphatase
MGSWPPVSSAAIARRPLAPLAIVTAAAFLFALLLILVRLQWGPLEAADHRAAAGTGNSFPSGHALWSIVCYGALYLVFLPATRGAWRRLFTVAIAAPAAAIGASRLLLGLHFVSDVLGGWALGVTWLGVTAFAFELPTASRTGEHDHGS